MAGRKPDSPASRTKARVAQPASTKRVKAQKVAEPETSVAEPRNERRGITLTRRVIILGVVAVVLLISYVSTLRVYFSVEREISRTKAEIAASEQRIVELEAEITRWEDPEYVKTQARERLGWVMPGEVGYRVVGADGELYGQTQTVDEGTLPRGERSGDAWFDKMWGTVRAADEPVPVEEGP